MEASAFDTNKYANRLVEAGVSQENANLQADAVGEVMQAVVSLDAKVEKYHAEDLVEFASIRAQLSDLDARVTKDLAEQRVLIAGQDIKFAGMDGRMTSMEGRMTSMEDRMTTMEGQMTSMEGRMTTMEGRMTSMEGRMTTMEGRMSSMEDKITSMEGRLTSLEAKTDNLAILLDAKISALEKRLMRWILIVGSALGVLQSAIALVPRYLG